MIVFRMGHRIWEQGGLISVIKDNELKPLLLGYSPFPLKKKDVSLLVDIPILLLYFKLDLHSHSGVMGL